MDQKSIICRKRDERYQIFFGDGVFGALKKAILLTLITLFPMVIQEMVLHR